MAERGDVSQSSSIAGSTRRKSGTKSKVGGLAVVALVAIYSFSAPRLNERYGWSLPAVKTDRDGNVRMADSAAATKKQPSKQTPSNQTFEPKPATGKSTSSTATSSSSPKPGPLSDRMRTADRATSSSSPRADAIDVKPSNAKTTSPTSAEKSDLLFGILREVSADRYISPAGLMYTPGSAEGHRLEHLRRHTVDDPSRPGSHGVFDGDMDGALATIDRAFDRAKKNQKTTKTEEDGRIIYTVDMGGRIGFVGGRDGGRKRNPMARRVRIVLDGNRVITAYPM
ncbi:hypothetical protein Poly51_24180 [Rubripirellula tenax]|uniref:Uncharacterized protein n=1 Tax=Rubripirellula tenax TaxID=2528015 RepID=A0A5C6F7S1_9BACT|nr:hypothetical protein [Rubripirellula tenax]TWU56507.1 hypothetical protein Poly51_24180 [Rubripirellula tenax]